MNGKNAYSYGVMILFNEKGMTARAKDLKLSLCKFCNSDTVTVVKEGLSGSENKKYRYECGKCGCKKNGAISNTRIVKK